MSTVWSRTSAPAKSDEESPLLQNNDYLTPVGVDETSALAPPPVPPLITTAEEDIRPLGGSKGEPNPAHAEIDKKDSASVDLERQIILYQQLQAAGDERATEAEAQRVAEAIRNVGNQQTNEETRNRWHKMAEDFYRASVTERDGILQEIGRGLCIIVAAPIALAAVAVFTAGKILYGVGTVLKGLGTVMTGGPFARRDGAGLFC